MVILSLYTRTLLVRLLQHRSFKSSMVKFQTVIILNSATSVRGSANMCYVAAVSFIEQFSSEVNHIFIGYPI